ncbi:MAG: hypothetical protein RBU37_16330 [Myxococcota bacterium]|jgi:hypothetical protein|nr:hypothetical protein [Myxococcota bacterium]
MTTDKLYPTTIDRALARGSKFLRALGINPRARRTLAAGGYSEADHQRGWELYLVLMGNGRKHGNAIIGEEPKAAIEEIDRSDEPMFKLARFSLEGRYPAQCEMLFDNLSAQVGYDSVIAMQTFIRRVQALRAGSPEDQAAAELLRQRKILTAERESALLHAIEVAMGLKLPAAVPVDDDDSYQQAARDFIAWLREWRGIASVLVTRRDDRIMLGLAKRRSSAGSKDEDDEDPELE